MCLYQLGLTEHPVGPEAVCAGLKTAAIDPKDPSAKLSPAKASTLAHKHTGILHNLCCGGKEKSEGRQKTKKKGKKRDNRNVLTLDVAF